MLLDIAGFSPGVIDGSSFTEATRGFRKRMAYNQAASSMGRHVPRFCGRTVPQR